MYDGSSRKAIAAFKATLDRAGLPTTVRLHPRARHRGRVRAARRQRVAPALPSLGRRPSYVVRVARRLIAFAARREAVSRSNGARTPSAESTK
jgi:hypothetical protein